MAILPDGIYDAMWLCHPMEYTAINTTARWNDMQRRNKQKKHIKEAATLKYNPEFDYAPQVTAAGRGYVAEKIIETAREAGVPIYRDEALAETLNRISVGDMIPRELYEVVAEVLAFVMNIDRESDNSNGKSNGKGNGKSNGNGNGVAKRVYMGDSNNGALV